MNDHHHHHTCGCCASIDRRDFVTMVSALALALPVLAATSAEAAPTDPNAKPRVCVVFFRPKMSKGSKYWMGWPGASYNIAEREAQYTCILQDAAAKLNVDVQVESAPIADEKDANQLLEKCKKTCPDGIIATVGYLGHHWDLVDRFVKLRGNTPTVVFSPMGTSFTGQLQSTRGQPHTYVAATQDLQWLATAVRLFRTIWDMKHTRLCVVNGDKTVDQVLDVIGTTLHFVPLRRWTDELAKLAVTPEVQALADGFSKRAKKTVEPKPQDVLNSAKNYFVARKIMKEENCQGISLNCLGLVADRQIPCPPCMAWLTLNDEASVGFCECDWNAGISLRLNSLLCGRPGFQQDPCPNTINNTLMGAHCSSPTKLRGFDQPSEPFILRSHSESDIGVSPQILWPVGEPVTVMKFDGPTRIILGTGRVVSNIDTPPAGGCRTSVEITMDGVADSRDAKGFHQIIILGKHDSLYRAYCQLASIQVVPL